MRLLTLNYSTLPNQIAKMTPFSFASNQTPQINPASQAPQFTFAPPVKQANLPVFRLGPPQSSSGCQTDEMRLLNLDQFLELQSISCREDAVKVRVDDHSTLHVPKPALIRLGGFFESYFNFQRGREESGKVVDDVSESKGENGESQSVDNGRDHSVDQMNQLDISLVISQGDSEAMIHLLTTASITQILNCRLVQSRMGLPHLVKLLFLADRFQFSSQVFEYFQALLKSLLTSPDNLEVFLQLCFEEFKEQEIPIHQVIEFAHVFADVKTEFKRTLPDTIPQSCLVCPANIFGNASLLPKGICLHCKCLTFCKRCFQETGKVISLGKEHFCPVCEEESKVVEPFGESELVRQVTVFRTVFPAIWLKNATRKKVFVDLVQFKTDIGAPTDPGLVDLIKPHLNEDLRKEIVPFLSLLTSIQII